MEVEIEHVQLEFIKEIENNISAMKVGGNTLCFALKVGLLFLIDLEKPSEVFKFQIPLMMASNNAEKLLAMWMHPNGKKLFIKTNFAKYYLCDVELIKQQKEEQGKVNGRSNGIYTMKKFLKKNYDVRSVTWIDENTFLCGTTDGNILHVNTVTKDGKPKVDAEVSSVYQLSSSIDGIFLGKESCCIIASGNKIMYWKKLDLSRNAVAELPTETEEFEHLHKDVGKKFDSHNQTFAWITQTGIVFGDVTRSAKVLGNAKVVLSVELPDSKHNIRDLILTDFHIIILRGWTVTVISQLNNDVVYEESIWSQNGERMLGLAADYHADPSTFWCFTSSNIYEIILHKEAQAVWKLLCEQGEYNAALALKGLSKWEREMIYYHKGCNLLDNKGDRIEAAKSLGLSSSSTVSSIALRLMDTDDSVASLQVFLIQKLNNADATNRVQKILLSSWIVWNYMKQLNDVDEKINAERNAEELKHWTEEKENVIGQFRDFLKHHLDCLDKETVYQIIAEQNRKKELLFFANLIDDYEYVLSYWIRQENWYEALRVLLNMQDPESVYKYASVLLVNSPEATIHTWMRIEGIQPVELISSLLTYFTNFQKQAELGDTNSENFALKYLLWYIEEHNYDASILYNSALYMIITQCRTDQDDETNELKTIQFLDKYRKQYDNDFILRLSVRYRKIKVSIYLYTQMSLFEDAVTLALENGMIDSAKLVLKDKNLEDNFKLRRALWLQISKSMLYKEENANDIKHTIKAIITESNNTLEIRDLLPMFDTFTTVANLKDELIRSLEKHGKSMSQISDQIRHSLQMKKEIAKDIELFRERYTLLKPGSFCASCKQVLQTRKFIVFPCGHAFHTDCLIKAILDSKDYNLKSKIENFQRRLSKDRNSVSAQELESIISTKCVLCSDINISNIDGPVYIDQKIAEKWNV